MWKKLLKSHKEESGTETVYFAADHAGFELKNVLLAYVRDELGYDVEDCGAHEYVPEDDYPAIIMHAAQKVAAAGGDARGIILGGSGQGEAMAANRIKGVRAAVYYGLSGVQEDSDGNSLDILTSARTHNDANVLSLGARFLSEDGAKEAVKHWLSTTFLGDERHARRNAQLDT